MQWTNYEHNYFPKEKGITVMLERMLEVMPKEKYKFAFREHGARAHGKHRPTGRSRQPYARILLMVGQGLMTRCGVLPSLSTRFKATPIWARIRFCVAHSGPSA